MYNSLFTDTVNVTRRVSSGTDSLGNPTYGTPSGWTPIYTGILVKVAFFGTPLNFAPTGERPEPNGVVYYPLDYIIKEEDRIIWNAVEYVVVSVATAEIFPGLPDHYEAKVALP